MRRAGLQVYAVEGSEMCLTGTAEVPLGGMLMDQIIPEEQLPMRMVAFGHCFRAESGSAGAKHTVQSLAFPLDEVQAAA